MTTTAIEDLDIDWTGSTAVIHMTLPTSTHPHGRPTRVQCPCGWTHTRGHGYGDAALQHAATHSGDVYCIAWSDGEIATEFPVGPTTPLHPGPEPELDLFTAMGVNA